MVGSVGSLKKRRPQSLEFWLQLWGPSEPTLRLQQGESQTSVLPFTAKSQMLGTMSVHRLSAGPQEGSQGRDGGQTAQCP